MAAPYIELETPLSEYTLVCRGCLADSGEMKNIREWGLAEDFCLFSGLQLRPLDGISELLCTSCEDTLTSCKRFRGQCQRSDAALRNVASRVNTAENESNKVTFKLEEQLLTFDIIAPDATAKIKLTCPYNCKNTYIKKKDLLIHLIKTHNINKNFVIETKYHCSVEDCSYNSSKWFTERKFLNQHHNKVHKSKDLNCTECDSNFSTIADYNRHLKTCNVIFKCDICDKPYNSNEKLLVHLMRHHPELHKEYKEAKKAEKRKSKTEKDLKKVKADISEYLIDSPKRHFATQTLDLKDTIKNDVTLPIWQTKKDEISTQTAFEDVLSLKSQNSEDDIFFSETVSLSDIQTQTFPEFGINRSNKETLTENSMDIKWTQTCLCYCDSPKHTYRLFDSVSSSPSSNLMTAETQTAEFKSSVKSDVLLSLNSAQTQTSFDESSKNIL